MKRLCSALTIVLLLCGSTLLYGQSKRGDLSSKVNVFIGTEGVGHTYPGATTPFGMVQLSPDTRRDGWSACSGYQYQDTLFYGFSHTHLSGTGGADLADILVLPLTEKIAISNDMRVEALKESEKAEPGYYTINLINCVKCELTATQRCGVHRYNFPKSDGKFIYFDLRHTVRGNESIPTSIIEKVSDYEIRGMRISTGWSENNQIYFVARFSSPIKGVEIGERDGAAVAFVEFEKGKKSVEAMVGISGVDYDGAIGNLEAEIANKRFNDIRKEARSMWNNELSRVTVEGGDNTQNTIFYTSLYHTMVCPNVFSDVDGRYRGMDGKVYESQKTQYHTFSLWDTFRAVHPLFNIVFPDRSADMISSLIDKGLQAGILPKWELWGCDTDCMIGNHAISVIAEAMMMDMEGFDYEEAYDLCKKTQLSGRDNIDMYEKYGYIPMDRNGKKSVSKTLEMAYNDYCLAMMAKKLGYVGDYEIFLKRSKNYTNLFNSDKGFFTGRARNRTFDKKFHPRDMGEEFTEATPWQYLHFVPHDIKGLTNLMGGRDMLKKSLDDLINADTLIVGKILPDMTGRIGQYAHGNEPSHGTLFLYNASSTPWQTGVFTRMVLDKMYSNTQKGLCGNDDCGQMSAWYVWTAMGLYPMSPINNELQITTPIFRHSSIKLADGKSFSVRCVGDMKNPYINKITLNGKEIDRNYITYQEVMAGGEMVFELSATPNKLRATNNNAYGQSATEEYITSTPFLVTPTVFYENTQAVELISRSNGATIYYTTDGTKPTRESKMYNGSFNINQTTLIRAIAYLPKLGLSGEMNETVTKIDWFEGVESIGHAKNGLNYSYYEGNIEKCSDMLRMKPVSTGIAKNTHLGSGDIAKRKEHWGIIYKGWLKIDIEEVYRIISFSDDGLVVYIDGEEVINNDGSHSYTFADAYVPLKKGYHSLEVRYFQGTHGAGLQFGITGSKVNSWMTMPSKWVFVKDEQSK